MTSDQRQLVVVTLVRGPVMTTRRQLELGRESLVEQLYRDYGETIYANGRIRTLRACIKKCKLILAVSGAKFLKRAMDIFISFSALVILSPLLLMVGLIIRLEDGGPALFWQTRIGLWGREFQFPKFRSMVTDAEQRKLDLFAENQHGSGITFKMKRDPRMTWIGSILRKLSIDELPQLWCVLCGEMSLVGPRPPIPYEVARYGIRDRRRLDVKPGLTCIWQVSGRSELSFEQQVRLDAQYIDSYSTLLDIALLLKTIPAILSCRGAY
jgi:lipopolysaccharide/colanic/teichoic acid biosynthesis glycosyltransferase